MAKQGRLELLAWLNEYLETDYPKIESLADGVAYCQLFDAISPPGTVPLFKLNFSAKFPDEFAKNYKILDEVFQKSGVHKVIPASSLIKGKFQENKEFLQWCHSYMLQKYPDGLPNYHAYQKRELALKLRSKEPTEGKSTGPLNSNLLPNKFSAVSPPIGKSTPDVEKAKITKSKKGSSEALDDKRVRELEELIASLEMELKESLLEIREFSTTVENSKLERDFYYSKLRAIERLCISEHSDDTFADILLETFAKDVPGFKDVEN